jgi:hypothetical protein
MAKGSLRIHSPVSNDVVAGGDVEDCFRQRVICLKRNHDAQRTMPVTTEPNKRIEATLYSAPHPSRYVHKGVKLTLLPL